MFQEVSFQPMNQTIILKNNIDHIQQQTVVA